MDDTTTNYIVAGIFGLLASVATYFATRKKTKAESADLLIDAAVKLVDSYEKRIKTLEDEVSDLRKEYKELLRANVTIIEENKSLHSEVVRLETILYSKGDMDK
jgi:LPXTG-motif cell wall-anchored protein